MRMHHVHRLGTEVLGQPVTEVRHVLEEVVLRHLRGWSGGHPPYDVAVLAPDGGRGSGRVAAGVHGQFVATAGESGGERSDVDVLPSGVGAAESGEGIGVLRNKCDLHVVLLKLAPRTATQSPAARVAT